MGKNFFYNGVGYQVNDEGCVLLSMIRDQIDHLVVPSVVFSPEGIQYKVIGFHKEECMPFVSNYPILTISFEISSEIETIPTYFICLSSIFFIPRRIKRIIANTVRRKSQQIICDDRNKFVSSLMQRSIINHFPLEILYQHFTRSRLFIRETTRLVGYYAFCGIHSIVSVAFPSSVEIIGDNAFTNCINLKSISFKQNSRLKRTGNSSFSNTCISSISFPESLEDIEIFSFYNCKNLTSISFGKNSKLKKIGDFVFHCINIRTVIFPASLEEIGHSTFYYCKSLLSISFAKGSKLRKIGECAFQGTNIETLSFPASIVSIGNGAFFGCKNLESISFPNGFNYNSIGDRVFEGTKIDETIISSRKKSNIRFYLISVVLVFIVLSLITSKYL